MSHGLLSQRKISLATSYTAARSNEQMLHRKELRGEVSRVWSIVLHSSGETSNLVGTSAMCQSRKYVLALVRISGPILRRHGHPSPPPRKFTYVQTAQPAL